MLSEERKRNLETGNRVREIRNGMDYTQTAMANELDVSLSAYKKIESGTMAITINMLKTLNEKFGVSADYILFGKEEHIEDIDEFVDILSEEEGREIYEELIDYFVNQKKKTYIVK